MVLVYVATPYTTLPFHVAVVVSLWTRCSCGLDTSAQPDIVGDGAKPKDFDIAEVRWHDHANTGLPASHKDHVGHVPGLFDEDEPLSRHRFSYPIEKLGHGQWYPKKPGESHGQSMVPGSYRSVVVMHLPHNMMLNDACQLQRLSRARSTLPPQFTIMCFWWTNRGSNVDDDAEALRHLRDSCGGRLVVFHKDVLPKYEHIIQNLTSPRGGWQWWYSDVPFVLTWSLYADTWLKGAAVIWYMEWDVQWTGSLGSILTRLSPNNTAYGYGIGEAICTDCDVNGHGACMTFKNDHHFIDRKKLCRGLIQMVWYSPKLLQNLFQHVMNLELEYCEAFAASVCNADQDCFIDRFEPKAPDLFDRFDWYWDTCSHCNEVNVSTARREMLLHPFKYCVVDEKKQDLIRNVDKSMWPHRHVLAERLSRQNQKDDSAKQIVSLTLPQWKLIRREGG